MGKIRFFIIENRSLFILFKSFTHFLDSFGESFFSPIAIIFFVVSVFFSVFHGFIQVRGLFTLRSISFKAPKEKNEDGFSSIQALFTALATTIGMGNMVGPSLAIFIGGPGAIFWLVLYLFFASSIKYTEVVSALTFKVVSPTGKVSGGPMIYLKKLHLGFAWFYGLLIFFLISIWSSLQANTLAGLFSEREIPDWIIGFFLSSIILFVFLGGMKRISAFVQKIVPIMFALYVIFSLLTILEHREIALKAIDEILGASFDSLSLLGAGAGGGFMKAFSSGVYRGIFVSEAGLGTSSIPHSQARGVTPKEQGVIAMYSMIVDAFLVIISGLLVVMSGVWKSGEMRMTLVYEAFKALASPFGQAILIITVCLFVFTTILGNTFNAQETFYFLTKGRGRFVHLAFNSIMIFVGAIISVAPVWGVMDLLSVFVGLTNLIGLIYLVFKYQKCYRL